MEIVFKFLLGFILYIISSILLFLFVQETLNFSLNNSYLDFFVPPIFASIIASITSILITKKSWAGILYSLCVFLLIEVIWVLQGVGNYSEGNTMVRYVVLGFFIGSLITFIFIRIIKIIKN